MEEYTVPATTKAEREEMEAARKANGASVDSYQEQGEASQLRTAICSSDEEIPYLLQEILRLTRENCQLRAVLSRMMNGG